MDGVAIAESDVLPMDGIAAGVFGLRIGFVNVFGVVNPDGSWTLLDAGLPGSAAYIRSWAEKQFGVPPKAIVLTHGHFDHVGACRTLADLWQVPVVAHPLEEPYLTGKLAYPPPDPGVGGGMMALLSSLYPKDPIDVRPHLRLLQTPGQSSIPELPEWQVLHTPGHTPGHVSFFRESDGTLLVGDAFCTTKPEAFFQAALVQHPELHGPPAYFTSDWTAAKASVQKLAALSARVLVPGHGKPLAGADVPVQLRKLAEGFDEVALPEDQKSDA